MEIASNLVESGNATEAQKNQLQTLVLKQQRQLEEDGKEQKKNGQRIEDLGKVAGEGMKAINTSLSITKSDKKTKRKLNALAFATITSSTKGEGKENNRKQVKAIRPTIPMEIDTTNNFPVSSFQSNFTPPTDLTFRIGIGTSGTSTPRRRRGKQMSSPVTNSGRLINNRRRRSN